MEAPSAPSIHDRAPRLILVAMLAALLLPSDGAASGYYNLGAFWGALTRPTYSTVTIGPILISADGDDGEVDSAGGSQGGNLYIQGETASSFANQDCQGEWVQGSRGYGYYRFQLPRDIPPGSTIQSATLSLYGRVSYFTTAEALRIWLQKTSSASQVATSQDYPGDLNGTTLTTASTRWPASGGLSWSTSAYNTSTNFATPAQELITAYKGLVAGDSVQVWTAIDTTDNNGDEVCSDDFAKSSAHVAKLSLQVKVASGLKASKLLVAGSTSLSTYSCSPVYHVWSTDTFGNGSNVTSDTAVTLSSNGHGSFYTDSGCTVSAGGSVTIHSGNEAASFYFMDGVAENTTLTASASGLSSGNLAVTVAAPTCTWSGAGGNANWSNGANWSNCPSAGLSNAPGATSTVVFDGSCSSNCSPVMDTNVSIAGITIKSGYSGTINQNGHTVTLSSTFSQNAGTYLGSTASFKTKSFMLTGGSFTATSGTLEADNVLTVSGGTFNSSTGTVALGDGLSSNLTTVNVNAGGVSFNNLTFNGTGGGTVLSSNLAVLGNLNVNTNNWDNYFTGSNYMINVSGNVTVASGVTCSGGAPCFMDSSSTTAIALVGNGTQVLDGGDGTLVVPNIKIASSGTVQLKNTIAVNNDWTNVSGTIDYTTYTNSVLIGGLGSGSSVRASNLTGAGTMTLGNVTIQQSGQNANIIGTFYVAGTFTLDEAYCGANLAGSGTLNLSGNVNWTLGGCNWGGTANVTLSGSANQTFTVGASQTITDGTLIINKSGGTVTLAGANLTSSNGSLTLTSGTLDLNGHSLSFSSGTLTTAAGTEIDMKGSEGCSFSSYAYNSASTVKIYGSTLTTTCAHYPNLNMSGTGTTTLNGSSTSIQNTLTLNSGTLSIAKATTVSGDIVIGAGTTLSAAANITAGGNWTNGGTFTPGTGTVTFTGGANHTINGSNTFYNLKMDDSTSAASTLTIQAGTTQTISNATATALTLKGASGKVLSLRSSSPGTQWNISPAYASGTTLGGFLDVQDSDNTSGNALHSGANFTDSGNNSGWSFP